MKGLRIRKNVCTAEKRLRIRKNVCQTKKGLLVMNNVRASIFLLFVLAKSNSYWLEAARSCNLTIETFYTEEPLLRG